MGDVCDSGLRALESFVFPANWASAVVFTWKGASVADPTLASSTARHHEHCAAACVSALSALVVGAQTHLERATGLLLLARRAGAPQRHDESRGLMTLPGGRAVPTRFWWGFFVLFLCFRSLVTLAIRGHAHTMVLNSPLQGTFVVGRSRLPSSAILRWVPTEVAVRARAARPHGGTQHFVDVQMVDLCQIHATSSLGRAGQPQTTVSARTVIGSILLLLRPLPRPPRLPQPRLLPNTSNWRATTGWTACTGPLLEPSAPRRSRFRCLAGCRLSL